MLIQKLYKNGNSVAVTIPKDLLEDLHLREGSEVVVKKQGEELIVTPKQSVLASDITPEFVRMLNKFVERHHDVLVKLAKR